MKKPISFIAAICLALTLTACSNEQKEQSGSVEQSTTSSGTQTSSQSEASSAENSTESSTVNSTGSSKPAESKPDPGEKLGEFNQSGTLSETVMYDKDGVKITASGLTYNNYSAKLELVIENNSDKNLSFVCGSVGCSGNSVNGYMVNDGYLNCDVDAGKKAADEITFNYNSLMLYGINEIADLEIVFQMCDDDYNYTYTEPCQVKTSLFEQHDYKKDFYKDSIVSDASKNTFTYELTHFTEDVKYEENGVKMLSAAFMTNQDGEVLLLGEFENTSDRMIYLNTANIAINGLSVYGSNWSNVAINPGKRGFVDINLSRVFDKEFWSIFGIKEIGSAAFSLVQRDSDGSSITESTRIELEIPGADKSIDTVGTELYSKNGLRIVSKTVAENPSEYSNDMYIFLIAENTSGEDMYVDDVYDSFSVNGFMSDYSFNRSIVENGKCSVIEIELPEYALEKNKISSPDEITEAEISFDIYYSKEEKIDEPTVKMAF